MDKTRADQQFARLDEYRWRPEVFESGHLRPVRRNARAQPVAAAELPERFEVSCTSEEK